MPERDQFLTTDQLPAQPHLTAAAQAMTGHQAGPEGGREAGVKLQRDRK